MAALIYAYTERCMSCRACEVACQRVHNGMNNITVVRVEDRFAVPLLCRHCDSAPCVAACYTGALTVTNGMVAFEAARCTACGLCLVACPFGVIGWTPDKRSIHKCDLCADRRTEGLKPVCALTCPAKALSHEEYGDFVTRAQRRAAAKMLRAAPLGS